VAAHSSLVSRRIVGLTLAILVAFVGVPSAAFARKQRDFGYRYEQVWSAAVRLLRVDLHARIEDQDPTNGFLIFELREGGRTHPGSLEVIRGELRGQPSVRAVVHLTTLPSYQETLILDKLERKMRDDFGEPLTRIGRPDAGVSESSDAGAGNESSESPPNAPNEATRGR
jgi:hypothetical protein